VVPPIRNAIYSPEPVEQPKIKDVSWVPFDSYISRDNKTFLYIFNSWFSGCIRDDREILMNILEMR
jgi:hypothetical protein